MACTIAGDIDITCDALKRAGGNHKKAWTFNLSDLRVPIDTSLAAYVTDLPLNTYALLRTIDGPKFGIEASSNLQLGDGGNVSYNHQVIYRVFSTTPTDDATLEDYATADTVHIIWTNNDEFKIYGGANGLTATAETDTTGRQITDSPVDTITLGGVERFKPKRLLIGGSVANTLAYLTSREA